MADSGSMIGAGGPAGGFNPVAFGADFMAGNYAASKQLSGSRKLMDQQFLFNKKVMKNKYTWTRQDLKKAGLNPMLAVAGGGMASSGLSSASGSAAAPQYGNNINSGLAAKRLSQELKNMQAVERKDNAIAKVNENVSSVSDAAANVGEVADTLTRKAIDKGLQNARDLKKVGKDMKSGIVTGKH